MSMVQVAKCYASISNGTGTAAEGKISKETVVVPQVSDKLASLDTAVLGIPIRICMFLGLPDPDPLLKRYGYESGSGSIPFYIKVLSGLKSPCKIKFLTQNQIFNTKLNF
jgi:hypothetical protein